MAACGGVQMTSDRLVVLERHDRVAVVTLNRPEKLNALSGELLDELQSVWAEVKRDDGVRVAILRGSGRAFSAGANLGEGGNSAAPAGRLSVIDDAARLEAGILAAAFAAWDLPKPVIAQVHGYCLGLGNLLATMTDVIITAENAQIGWPQMPLGGGLISPIWAWLVGPHLAKEYSFVTGKMLSGAEAVSKGWGNRAVPEEQLATVTMELAREIAKVPADMLSVKKAAINDQLEAQGFRNAVLRGATRDAVAHTSEAVAYTRGKLRELGMKGALDWWKKGEGIP
jgi:enoyl-CoA hydratase